MTVCDVLVVGSGAGGLAAAARAHDKGLSVKVIEKAAYWGGTSAISGGAVWFPCNPQYPEDDPVEAKQYLQACVGPDYDEARISAYLDRVPETVAFLKACGVCLQSNAEYPDYRQDFRGAAPGGRTMDPMPFDGKQLGKHFHSLRDQLPFMKVFGRISLSNPEGRILSLRRKGWIKLLLSMAGAYWLDIPWRLKTKRGRRLTMGSSLVAPLGNKLFKAGIEIKLNQRLRRFERDEYGHFVCQIEGPDGLHHIISRSVILASGGFEHSKSLRQQHMAEGAIPDHSASPRSGNTGDGLGAAQAMGAAVTNLGHAWWAPAVRGPMGDDPNAVYVLFMERAFPGGVVLNKRGERFANEAKSYNDFGLDMIEDQKRTGGTSDAWLVFDAGYRQRYMVGPLMAGGIQPDKALPQDWLGKVFYRDQTLKGLALQIGLPSDQVAKTLEAFNRHAAKGQDPQFHRGENIYDRYFGDPSFDNPNLAPVVEAPFYAIKVVLGDLGTNGGLVTDHEGAVLDGDGQPIKGLFAVGNASASVMGQSYPGAGGTLGPAISFGIAAADAAARLHNFKSH